ncbi:MAG: ATP-binding protein, partial [Pseudomonadota bacterium]
ASLPLEFSITDNAGGIAEEIKAHIFEPFVTTRTNGSGLGLALVAKIIGSHGGVIECDSHSGGTTFRILLPAWQEGKAVRNG